MARSSWTHVTGTVVAATVYRMYGGAGQGASATRWKYIVELRADGEEPGRVELKQKWGLFRRKMINPIEGSHVPLLLNAKTGEIRFDAESLQESQGGSVLTSIASRVGCASSPQRGSTKASPAQRPPD